MAMSKYPPGFKSSSGNPPDAAPWRIVAGPKRGVIGLDVVGGRPPDSDIGTVYVDKDTGVINIFDGTDWLPLAETAITGSGETITLPQMLPIIIARINISKHGLRLLTIEECVWNITIANKNEKKELLINFALEPDIFENSYVEKDLSDVVRDYYDYKAPRKKIKECISYLLETSSSTEDPLSFDRSLLSFLRVIENRLTQFSKENWETVAKKSDTKEIKDGDEITYAATFDSNKEGVEFKILHYCNKKEEEKEEEVKFCYDDCEHLKPTEVEQDLTRKTKTSGHLEMHTCERYWRQVHHNAHHPKLVRLKKCAYSREDAEKTEEWTTELELPSDTKVKLKTPSIKEIEEETESKKTTLKLLKEWTALIKKK